MAKPAPRTSAKSTQFKHLVLIDEPNITDMESLASKLAGSKPPAAFVGAGLTARAGLPTWEGLIKNLVQQIGGWTEADVPTPEMLANLKKQIGTLQFSTNDLVWRASFCFDRFEAANRRGEYFATLESQFRNGAQDNPVLDAVIRLPFSQFLTTNYDPSISESYSRIHGKQLGLVDWGLKAPRDGLDSGTPSACRCVHLHGHHSRPEGIILREEDYQKRYFMDVGHVKELKRFLRSNPVVFIGFSLNDLDVMNVLRMLKAGRSEERGSHYAIMPLSDERPDEFVDVEKQRLSDKYGITPIFYRRLTNRFRGLDEAISLLSGYVSRYKQAPPAAPAQVTLVRAKAANKMKQVTAIIQKALKKPRVPDDPNKGVFGGLAVRNGRRLSAQVTRTSAQSRWFRIEVKIDALPNSPNLSDGGKIYVHPTFPSVVNDAKVSKNGRRIERKFWAYGAFTVGAVLDGGETLLELDLADLSRAPKDFRER